ncbi:MAG: putative glycosyltransferase [Gammaproteobacteria bacterium]|nr:putative glycosyltransferase [Gammaproteobacteria bacterium]
MISLPESEYDVVGSIVTYKTDAREVEQALRQFLAIPLKVHLCIIDNSPTPVTLPKTADPRISYYFANSNLGYGRAHNIALRASRGRARYNLVMNTDITYSPDVVTRLVDFMDAHPEAGLAGPKVLYPDGSLQHVCRLLPTPANMFLRRFLPRTSWTERADALYELRWWDHECVANIPYFQGSFMLLRTQLCNRLEGFDERFFLYGEDIDLTRRIYGVAQALYVPDVKITHEYRRFSNRSLLGTWYGIQNNCRYFNKWGWFFDRERRKINREVVAALRACS